MINNKDNINFSISAESIGKKYNRWLFRDMNINLNSPASLSVTGANGSGKSTLLEILAGVKLPGKGSMNYYLNNKQISKNILRIYSGFVSQAIVPYNELTCYENIQFILNPERSTDENAEKILRQFFLYDERKKQVKHFSSGMKQRLKLVFAILNNPEILFLDEPTTNLDDQGKEIFFSYIKSVLNKKIIIIATNDNEEAGLCSENVHLG